MCDKENMNISELATYVNGYAAAIDGYNRALDALEYGYGTQRQVELARKRLSEFYDAGENWD